jgi:hypothetical protein
MPRTSNRRWKGCPMCKPHKFAQQGDNVRIPRRFLKHFNTRNGKRVNRHDTGVFDD